MKPKRIAAAVAGLCLLWGAVNAEQPQPATPDATGATGPGILMFELRGAQPGVEPSPEEMAVMQMLLLQLLMMQAEPENADMQIVVPSSGTRI